MKQEKQFINNCLNLIDLSVFPDVPAGFINETRRLILSAMEEDGYDPEFLKQRKSGLHSKIFPVRVNKTVRINTWNAISALFPDSYTASGDPLIESFTLSMIEDFNISEDLVESLLYDCFKDIVNR